MAKKTRTDQELKEGLVKHILIQSLLINPDHTLIHIEDSHYKFYQLKLVDNTVEICYGKINSAGNYSVKTFDNNYMAKVHLEKLLKEKLNKGYEEPISMSTVTAAAPKKTSTKKLTAEGLSKLDAFLSTLNS